MSTSKLGFEARITLDLGSRDTLDWYLANDGWGQKVIDRKAPRSKVRANETSCRTSTDDAV
jgi:dTDP-D-glucose 4,6-dehydratase